MSGGAFYKCWRSIRFCSEVSVSATSFLTGVGECAHRNAPAKSQSTFKDESADVRLTMDNIKAVILDMFAAGTDTTFITLDWAMTELAMNPKAMRAAQQEVRAVVGNRASVAESDLGQLPYMKAVIKETLRLHPPVPVLVPRESMKAVTIEGYDIPVKPESS
ncbi:hypothetical protein HPP92_009708 [Vanilla planifolia]|uniref:Uncharacterized protein n=1 Tax=Vanilla planifolia TaxID=51239 RepID=A0A835V7P1_VANPL|nr:hypothetical protein HPP92_009708 [Vanilla planifolia]